jgi:uncharacterized Tic20 family protein
MADKPTPAAAPPAAPTPAPPAPPAATDGGPSEDERNQAMLCHAGGILPPFFLVPLLMWKSKGKESAFVEEHAKEALNFEVTLNIGDVVALIVLIAAGGWGLFIWAPVMLLRMALGIMGSMAAMKGQPYRYVVNARLIK